MSKVPGFILLTSFLVITALIAHYMSLDTLPVNISMDELVHTEPVLRGETVKFICDIENPNSKAVEIVDAQTSCGCADLQIVGAFVPARTASFKQFTGTLGSGVSELQLTIDSTGKGRGSQDFEFALMFENPSGKRYVDRGFVSVEVQQGLRSIPPYLEVDDSSFKHQVGVYSDSKKVSDIGSVRVSHPKAIRVTRIEWKPNQREDGFRQIAAFELEVDPEIFNSLTDEFSWVEFLGDSEIVNANRVIIKKSMQANSATSLMPAKGLTLLLDKNHENQLASFYVNSTEVPKVFCDQKSISKNLEKLDETTWVVELEVPTSIELQSFDLKIHVGEQIVTYPIRLMQ